FPGTTSTSLRIAHTIQNKNSYIDPFVEEDALSSPSMWALSSNLKGKRAATGSLQTTNKERSNMTLSRDEYAGVEESLDSTETTDKH
ncbi:hypothetical protein BX616_009284, partial [Lobosporangium transversale]